MGILPMIPRAHGLEARATSRSYHAATIVPNTIGTVPDRSVNAYGDLQHAVIANWLTYLSFQSESFGTAEFDP